MYAKRDGDKKQLGQSTPPNFFQRRWLMNRLCMWSVITALVLCGRVSVADTFGIGPNTFAIDFVSIGNPGNPPDANPNPAGAVGYEYRMGKYEISEQMIDKANAVGGLGITK